MRLINAAAAELEAYEHLLAKYPEVILMGEGIVDAKACFGTTRDLDKKFPNQIFESPTSENGITGIQIGMAINGLKPIVSHMRVDFLLYAMDQIINNAAKWESMFNGRAGTANIVVKAFIGRGFGSGNQHAQNLAATFAHIPGLVVVMPSTAYNSKGLLIAASEYPGPVIFLGSRWVHHLESDVPHGTYTVPIGQARVAKTGKHVTIVAWSYMVTESIKAAKLLEAVGIEAEIIDLQTVKPIDYPTIIRSLEKTRRLFVVDEAWEFAGISAEILAWACEADVDMDRWPKRQTCPNRAVPSSYALTKKYYPTSYSIAREIAQWFDKVEPQVWGLQESVEPAHDVPNKEFKGPF